MTKALHERRLLNVTDAATYLGVSVEYLYRAARARRVPAARIGRRLLFDPVALAKFVERQTTAVRR